MKTTIYSTVPMQLFMTHAIKQPILDSVETLFDPNASKVSKLKAIRILWKAYQEVSKLPEPTLENTWHPNAHNLIILRDWVLEWCILDSKRVGLIRKVFNFVIILIDFDPPWRWVFDSLKEEADKMEWKSKDYGRTGETKYSWWRKLGC
ncbi:hypothetical protein LCGC14_1324550 [marine sediment metagenome]|uniref:Uncharacterized protein n=1 Tax=marine sediment metagenome TaxID=412755 RepID=A0A0F9L449_9ZZZZ